MSCCCGLIARCCFLHEYASVAWYPPPCASSVWQEYLDQHEHPVVVVQNDGAFRLWLIPLVYHPDRVARDQRVGLVLHSRTRMGHAHSSDTVDRSSRLSAPSFRTRIRGNRKGLRRCTIRICRLLCELSSLSSNCPGASGGLSSDEECCWLLGASSLNIIVVPIGFLVGER